MAQKGSKLKLQKDVFTKAMKMTQAEDRKHAHLKTCILYKKKKEYQAKNDSRNKRNKNDSHTRSMPCLNSIVATN